MKALHQYSILFTLALCAATPAAAQRPAHVTALDVRRACLNPDSAAREGMKPVCGLVLPKTRRELARPDLWTPWTQLFHQSGYSPADSILKYAAALDEERVLAADVLDLIDPEERSRILRRVGQNAAELRRELNRLTERQKSELVRGIFALQGEVAAETDSASLVLSELVKSAAEKVEQGIDSVTVAGARGAASSQALAGALSGKLQTLSESELFVLVSSHPEIERQVLKKLLGERTVADLVETAPGRESTRLATLARQQLSGSAAPSSSHFRSLGSNVAWGVSDFVVERVERQLRTYAIRGLTSRICADVGEAILRESCQVLGSSHFGISSAGTGMLRSAVRRDLERLPVTALAWTYDQYDERLDDASKDRLQVVMRGVGFALHVSRGEDPWLAFASAVDSLVPGRRSMVYDQLRRLREELDLTRRQIADTTVKTNKAQLRRRAEDIDRRLRALGQSLVPQSLDSGEFPLASIVADLGSLYSTRFDRLRIRPAIWDEVDARELLRAQLIAMLANARTDAQGQLIRRQFQPWRFAAVAVAVDEELGQINRVRASLDSLQKSGLDTLRLRTARLELVQGAFSALDRILAEVQRANLADVTSAQHALTVAREVVVPLVEGDYGTAVLGLRDQVAVLVPTPLLNPGQSPHWMRGLTFVSELSGAASADQVNSALVRLTEGGQGFEAKRDTGSWRFALNAFGGVFGGADWGDFTRERAGGKTAAFGGLYLPLGLAITSPWVFRPLKIARLGTIGAFVQAADLGALASWRLEQDSTVDERPEIDVGQVFSPGLFLVLNVRGLPISVGYGWSYSPQLRRGRDVGSNSEEGEEEQADEDTRLSADRRGIFIAVDVPLFP